MALWGWTALVLLLCLGTATCLRCVCDMKKGSAEPCVNGYCTGNDNHMDVSEVGSLACLAINVTGKGVLYGCRRHTQLGRETFCQTKKGDSIGTVTMCWCRSADYCNRNLFDSALLDGNKEPSSSPPPPTTTSTRPTTRPTTTTTSSTTRTTSTSTRSSTSRGRSTTTRRPVLYTERKTKEPAWSKTADRSAPSDQNADVHRRTLLEQAKMKNDAATPLQTTAEMELVNQHKASQDKADADPGTFVVSGKTGQVLKKADFDLTVASTERTQSPTTPQTVAPKVEAGRQNGSPINQSNRWSCCVVTILLGLTVALYVVM